MRRLSRHPLEDSVTESGQRRLASLKELRLPDTSAVRLLLNLYKCLLSQPMSCSNALGTPPSGN